MIFPSVILVEQLVPTIVFHNYQPYTLTPTISLLGTGHEPPIFSATSGDAVSFFFF